MRTIAAALCLVFLLSADGAWAQRNVAAAQAASDAVARSLEAQYQAERIASGRRADERELQLIASYEAQLRSARARYDARAAGAQAGLEQARAQYVDFVQQVAARDAASRAEFDAYRAEVQGVVRQASPELLEAYQRFADGDRVNAWRIIDPLMQAQERATAVAANDTIAASKRQRATFLETMRINGEATARDVLMLLDEARALSPEPVRFLQLRLRLDLQLGRLDAVRANVLSALSREDVARDGAVTAEMFKAYREAGAAMASRQSFVDAGHAERTATAQERATFVGGLRLAEARLEEAREHAAREPRNRALQRQLANEFDTVFLWHGFGEQVGVEGENAQSRVALFDEALEIRSALLTENADDPDLRREVYAWQCAAAQIARDTGGPEVIMVYNHPSFTLDELVRLTISDPTYEPLQVCALELYASSVVMVLTANSAEDGDVAYVQQLLELARTVSSDSPLARYWVATSLYYSGVAQQRAQRGDGGVQQLNPALRESMQIATQLYRADPENDTWREQYGFMMLALAGTPGSGATYSDVISFEEGLRSQGLAWSASNLADAYESRGLDRYYEGQVAEGIADMDASVAAFASESNLLYRGRMHMTQRDYRRALVDFDRLSQFNPNWEGVSVDVCRAIVAIGEDLQRATQACGAADDGGRRDDLQNARGLLNLRRGEHADAIVAYDAALQWQSHFPEQPRPQRAAEATYGRGIARLRLGQTTEGQADLAAARRLDPNVDQLFESYSIRP